MLRQRILTALVLIPMVVGAIFKLDTVYFAGLCAAFVLWGSFEWAELSGVTGWEWQSLYLVLMLGLLWLSYTLLDQFGAGLWFFLVAGLWWIFIVIQLWRFQPLPKPEKGVDVWQMGAGVVTLVPAWLALVALHGQTQQGPVFVFFLLVLVWTADSSAFFAGKRWGRSKLAPNISPGKTKEGLYAALVVTAACGFIMAWVSGYKTTELWLFAAVCLVAAAFSVVGDLFESLVKRRRGVKDSGTILPGHGGILDRIDSITAAGPIFVLGLTLTGLVE